MKSTPEPGIHHDVPADDYHAWDARNFSKMKTAAKSMAHYHHELTHPTDSTPAQILGRATHCAILEPDLFPVEYAGAPKFDKRTTAGKKGWAAFQLEHANATALPAEDYDLCVAMSKAAWAHPLASQLLKGSGSNEVSVLWIDEDGTPCKARIDRITAWEGDGWTHACDVKTAQDASPEGFRRAIGNYRYDWQAAHYLDGLDAIDHRERKFTFIAIEKEPPHAIGVYQLLDWCLEDARDELREVKAKINEAQKTDVWPGYPAEIVELELPRWRQKGEWA